MTLTKLEMMIKEIANTYFTSMRYLRKARISSGDEDIYSPFQKYYRDVERAFSLLSHENKRIITNEFFYDGYANWWIGTYTNKQFRKKKKNAIKEFMEAFYEIH